MTEVVDLNVKRLEKTVRQAQAVLGTDKPVQLLECCNCQQPQFLLTHEHEVVCATCNTLVPPLRWFDVNDKPPAA